MGLRINVRKKSEKKRYWLSEPASRLCEGGLVIKRATSCGGLSTVEIFKKMKKKPLSDSRIAYIVRIKRH